MDEKAQAILEMDLGIGKKYGKPYHYASQEHQLVLLEKYSRVKMSTRTLNRKRRKLEDAGYIRRIKRHRRDKGGKFSPGSTITMVLARGFYHMARVMKKALKVFSFYRLPKMAHNMFDKTDYLSFVGKLRACDEKFTQQRMDAASVFTA